MEEPNGNGAAAEVENFPLDEALISFLEDVEKARVELEQKVQLLAAQRQGALVLFIRQHKLSGDWRVAENGKELVRPAPAPAPGPEKA